MASSGSRRCGTKLTRLQSCGWEHGFIYNYVLRQPLHWGQGWGLGTPRPDPTGQASESEKPGDHEQLTPRTAVTWAVTTRRQGGNRKTHPPKTLPPVSWQQTAKPVSSTEKHRSKRACTGWTEPSNGCFKTEKREAGSFLGMKCFQISSFDIAKIHSQISKHPQIDI